MPSNIPKFDRKLLKLDIWGLICTNHVETEKIILQWTRKLHVFLQATLWLCAMGIDFQAAIS